jgi:hypothetical protein
MSRIGSTQTQRGQHRTWACDPAEKTHLIVTLKMQRNRTMAMHGSSWGGVLAKQAHGKEALANYEALKYAPHWKQLQETREAVAK